MTTTSTFQGMNTDGKPSSRVLNPPGGASSNIFGFDDSATPQKTPVKNNPDNVNRGNNDIFHQGNHPVESTPNVRNSNNVNRGSNDIFNQGAGVSAAQPAKSTRAPRSGEDSLHNYLGTRKCIDLDKNESSLSSLTLGSGRRRTSPDTFSNVFGDTCSLNRRKTFRKYSDKNIDSYSRIFGETDIDSLNSPSDKSSHDSLIDGGSSYNSLCSTPNSSEISSYYSVNSYNRARKEEKVGLNSSFDRVFGKFPVEPKQPRVRRYCDTSAYNPITGEAYEQTSTKQEQVTAQKCEEKPSSEKQEAETPGSVKQEAEAADNLKQEALPEVKKQDNGGILGSNTNKPQDHPSTRVSQPPGGRSTKLW